MPMSNHAARKDHMILRTVLIALSIMVLLVCVLMWWVTAFDTTQPMVVVPQTGTYHASLPAGHAPGPDEIALLG